MFSRKFSALILCIGLTTVLAGCDQQTEKDQIAEAQFCLDKATDATSANACVAKIASLTSPMANALRCSAGFIAAGITSTDNLSKALTAIKDSNGTASATTMMSYLNLGTDQNATTVFGYCSASGSNGMALISAMARSATTLINLVGGASFNPSNSADVTALKTKITDLATKFNANANDPTIQDTLSAIGGSIQTVYDSTCGGSNSSSSDICKSINSALASLPPNSDGSSIDLSSTSPIQIAGDLLTYWNQQNGH